MKLVMDRNLIAKIGKLKILSKMYVMYIKMKLRTCRIQIQEVSRTIIYGCVHIVSPPCSIGLREYRSKVSSPHPPAIVKLKLQGCCRSLRCGSISKIEYLSLLFENVVLLC